MFLKSTRSSVHNFVELDCGSEMSLLSVLGVVTLDSIL
jgi:hypothetical protein